MKITPTQIQILEKETDKVIEGNVGILNGKLLGVPTRVDYSDPVYPDVEQDIEQMVFLGVEVEGLDGRFPTWEDASNEWKALKTEKPFVYTNIYESQTFTIIMQDINNPIIEKIEVPDVEYEGFELGLPTTGSGGYIFKEGITVPYGRYKETVEAKVEELPLIKGAYAFATDTKNTWYCDGITWNNNNIK